MALYRQGRIPGSVYTGRGQEAVAAAAGYALGPDDVVAPLNRELACHFARGATTADAFRNFFGKATSPTFGRDGNMHFGAPANGVFPLVSMLGDLVPVVAGAALAFKKRGQRRVAMTFLGEGAFSVGDTHEGLNLAAVWQVPAVFVIQANRYSYSTPVAQQMVNTNIAQRIYGGWSIPAERVDGTDALAVLETVRDGSRAGAKRRRPAGRRGTDGADARARGARRLPLRARRHARGVLRAVRPGRTPRGPARARRLQRDGDRRDARSGNGGGRSRPRGGRAGARARPGDDRGRRLRGAAVAPSRARARAAPGRSAPRASARGPSRGHGGDGDRCGRSR